MSYFDSLSQWQSANQQIRSHQQDIEQEANNYKAQDTQEKFDHMTETMSQSANALMGLGGGIHLARSVYKKVKGVKRALQGKKNTPNLNEQPETNENSETQNNDTQGYREAPREEEDDEDFQDAQEAPTEATEAPEPVELQDATQFQRDPDFRNEDFENNDLEGEDPMGDSNDFFAQMRGESTPQGVTQSSDGSLRATQAPTETTGDLADTGATDITDNLSTVREGGQNLLDTTASSVSDSVASTTSTLAETGADVASSALNVGLDTAGAALDFLGPAGELVGAGLALGSLFSSIFGHKHKESEEQKELNEKTNIGGSSGISTESMGSSATKSNVVGTIV